MDEGAERIRDESELRQIRRQAHMVHVKALLAAVVLTALSLLAGG
jgi:hypothetical protein